MTKKRRRSGKSKKKNSWGWILWLIIPILLFLGLFQLYKYSTQEGTVAGIIVYNDDHGGNQGGTAFVVKHEGEKLLCTIGHIAVAANLYGIKAIDESFKLQDDFTPFGFDGGTEMIYCAKVKTNWSAFNFSEGPPPVNQEAFAYRAQGRKTSLWVKEVNYVIANETEKMGVNIVTTGVAEMRHGDSGAPLVIDNKVIGVLTGGSGLNIFFTPVNSP